MKQQLEKPFSSFWYGKDVKLESSPKKNSTNDNNTDDDDQYRLFKKAIQAEALRKWR
ncbi:hypothetical protein ACFFHM_02075 [Halalkalibacter kiskunsagensis]|uniref:Uncharacterized protein n=1 Tax=Halalkalibacter kiskunsagensis TaxID=1548599 RepID=A0ABV6K8G1_9BACI